MKEQLLELAAQRAQPRDRLNLVREFLQAYVLRLLQQEGAFAAWAFQGGTALRFLHGLRRYSEDLDFARERPDHDPGFEKLLEKVQRALTDSGYVVETRVRVEKTVHASMVKFPGLLLETGLSSSPTAKLGIRIEVDTNPPVGAILETRLVTRHFPITLRAHDLSSCMAGKVHALLARGHAKGRDLFDLAWYLTHPERPVPNLTLLANALTQTEWLGPKVTERSWKAVLTDRVRSLDWPAVIRDVEPFLEDPGDRQLLDRDLLLRELLHS